MSTISAWELETFYEPQDVLIAGGGFAGLWTAYHLKKLRPHWKVLILERSLVPVGASTRNAGFACFGSATELMVECRTVGVDQMLKTFATRFEGIRQIRSLFTAGRIDYEHLGGYELISTHQYTTTRQLLQDLDWLNEQLAAISGEPQTFTQAPSLLQTFGFGNTTHLVENALEGQLHPGKLHATLLSLVKEMGVRVLTGIELTAWTAHATGIAVDTLPQMPLKANQLVIATNIPGEQLAPGNGVLPARGQVLLTAPIEKLPFKGSFHYDEGYYYFRNLGNRVLLGGARNLAFEAEQTHERVVSDEIQQALERFLSEVVLPNIPFTIEQRWSGIMGMPPGREPVVQKLVSNCYTAVGLGGIGVAIAPVVGQQVAELLVSG